ncbi:MAG: DUF2207 domain-containing protein [Meiothermus sp.]|uniref:DUF2207 domain-containing protein n=1 Tax=Meiothermus sp. TaxID=1955249 RepID=UPI0025F284FC|nr:DUF2207 domain-containing protein [Meiothermus sp.]MCS7067379.1 DUF2207 domain-containing protein [Meiothermus sp.]MCX7600457.1 DUF2207 domain-containing protein [Meiothermus sp.]MDW8424666.1 DUF2207 domain-containing protein [Meiothermus sp.]
MNLLRGWLWALALLGLAWAKSYSLERVEQEVYLEADGRVRVVDVRTWRFEGAFREVFLEIDPRRGGQVRFEEASALDDGRPIRYEVQGNRISLTAGPPDPSGNLPVLAENQSRTFRIRYTLTGEVTVARDAALFDRQVLEPFHAAVDSYLLRIHAPQAVPERFRVFIFTGRGRLGTLEFDQAKRVATVQLAPVSQDEFVRARVILDARAFNFRSLNEPRFEQWLKETEAETRAFRERARRLIENQQVPGWAWGLAAGPLGLFLVLAALFTQAYQRYGREPRTEEVGRYYREPAEPIPPGMVPYVMTQTDPGPEMLGRMISATLLDFARRGSVELIRHENTGPLGLFGGTETHFKLVALPEDATGLEIEVWNLLRAVAGQEGVVRPDALKKYFQQHPSLLTSLSRRPRAIYEAAHGKLLDENSGRAAVRWGGWSVGLGFLFLLLSLTLGPILLDRLGEPLWVGVLMGSGVLSGIGLLVMGLLAFNVLTRWMPDKLLNARRWRAYRNFLADFSQMESAPPEHFKMWDYHFVYAAALGVAERYLRNLRQIARRRPEVMTAPRWIPGSPGQAAQVASSHDMLEQISRMTGGLEQITRNLESLERALKPSSGGAGGGFGGSSSGGSSGGGGSSGAR